MRQCQASVRLERAVGRDRPQSPDSAAREVASRSTPYAAHRDAVEIDTPVGNVEARVAKPALDLLGGMPTRELRVIPVVVDHCVVLKGEGRVPEALHEEVVHEALQVVIASLDA